MKKNLTEYLILKAAHDYVSIIDEMRNHILEIKAGKKYGLKLVNKITNEHWISSTNDIDQRKNRLASELKKRDLWNAPWIEKFGNLPDEDILEHIDFIPITDINTVTLEYLITHPISQRNDNSVIRVIFLKLINDYFKENKYSDDVKSKIGKVVKEFFVFKKDEYKQLSQLISNIESCL